MAYGWLIFVKDVVKFTDLLNGYIVLEELAQRLVLWWLCGSKIQISAMFGLSVWLLREDWGRELCFNFSMSGMRNHSKECSNEWDKMVGGLSISGVAVRYLVEQSAAGRFVQSWYHNDMFGLLDLRRKLLLWGPRLNSLLQVDFVQSWHHNDLFGLQDSRRKLRQWGPWLSNLHQVDFVQSWHYDDMFDLQDSSR